MFGVPRVLETTSLDDLSAEEIDDLPFGVIQVDRAGTVLLYNAAESRLSGRAPEQVVGRDFFRDVAPCTHLPAFHGRFLEGVRAGDLDAAFGFVFGFDPPQRVTVRMTAARTPDRYWITVEPQGALAPSPHRIAAAAAKSAVDARARAQPIDAHVCEREPIHVPGAVQPHAAMLAIDPATLTVTACSDNVIDLTGRTPASILDQPIDAVLSPAVATQLGAALASGRLAEPARPWRQVARLGPEDRLFALTAHLHDGRLILEAEMTASRPEDFGAATPLQAQDAVTAIRAATDLAEAATVCAHEIRLMTGFERVLVYRFDSDWNGEALGESRTDAYPSLLGLRFPASDIPAQARALYTRAPARFVVDRDATPATVVAAPAAGNHAVDLSFAQSRALSPIHLEYQRNLGVNGSMSVSILVEGALWGLVIGHHRKPHYVTPDTRALASLVTDAFALRVHELASSQALRAQHAALDSQNALLRQLAEADDAVLALTDDREGRATLLDLFDAGGAALVTEDGVATIGRTPDAATVADLAKWLRATLAEPLRVFVTADLSAHWPGGARCAAVAAGLLAAFADAERRHLLIWFRPEVATTVVWGGDPNKPVLEDPATRTVLPRRSFERWVEERRGQAEPWADWHADTAGAFAAALEGVVLRQSRRITALSEKERALTHALEQRQLLSREIDHRVRNSLQIVASVMLLQSRRVADQDARAAFENTYARVMSVARVHDRLQQTDDAETVDLGRTLQQLCEDLVEGIAEARHRVDVDAQHGLMVPSRTAVALALIATELVTNALKYAYPDGASGAIEVRVHARGETGVELHVCDQGRGLPPDWDRRQRDSGGLGMRVIRAMLGQIDAEMTVDPDRAPGTCFHVHT